MNTMPRARAFFKLGLLGLAVFAVAGFSAAQAASAADRVLLLQAKRFEGTFRLSSGETKLKVGDDSAKCSLSSVTTNLTAALAPKAGRPDRATLTVDGRTIEGKVAIEGRTLTFDFTDRGATYRIVMALSGRNEGKVSVTKDKTTLVTDSITRAA